MNNGKHATSGFINLESLVSDQTGKAWIKLTWGGQSGQLTPKEARQHAYDIMETANAADEDAFLYEWVTTHLKVPPEKAILILRDFREWRARQ